MPNSYTGYNGVVMQLAKFVQKKYNQHAASWHSDTFSLRAAMSLIFAAQLDSIRILSDLKQNSANCKFTIAKAKASVLSSETSLFVKVIDYPTKKGIDSILVDNVNGKIFNWFMQQYPDMQGYFMFYVDSFLNWSSQDKKRWNYDITSDITNPQSPLFIPEGYPNEGPERKPSNAGGIFACYPQQQVSISCAIKGRSLQDYFERACESAGQTTYEQCRSIMLKFASMYEQMRILGRDWGMLHNDLHLGNLLFDEDAQKIVCIDYGRVHFQRLVEEPVAEINEFAKTEVDKLGLSKRFSLDYEAFKSGVTPCNYKDVMDKLHRHTKSDTNSPFLTRSVTVTSVKYPMYVMDLMTLAGNMYLFFLAGSKRNKGERIHGLINPFFKVYAKGHKKGEPFPIKKEIVSRNLLLRVFDVQKTWANYNRFLQNIIQVNSTKGKSDAHDWQPFFSIIAEGLMYMAIVLARVNSVNIGQKAKVPLINNDRNTQAFWHHFQYIGHLDYITDAIETVEKLKQNAPIADKLSSVTMSPMESQSESESSETQSYMSGIEYEKDRPSRRTIDDMSIDYMSTQPYSRGGLRRGRRGRLLHGAGVGFFETDLAAMAKPISDEELIADFNANMEAERKMKNPKAPVRYPVAFEFEDIQDMRPCQRALQEQQQPSLTAPVSVGGRDRKRKEGSKAKKATPKQ